MIDFSFIEMFALCREMGFGPMVTVMTRVLSFGYVLPLKKFA